MNFFKALSFITISIIKKTSGQGEQATNISSTRYHSQFNENIRKSRGLRGLASTTAPSSSPSVESHLGNSNEYPTLSPMSRTPSWLVGLTTMNIVGANAFLGKTEVRNGIGWSVPPSNVFVELYDFDCKNKKDSLGLEVSLETYEYVSSPSIYDVLIHTEKFEEAPGSFVTFTGDTGASQGSVEFCTRVYTYSEDLDVAAFSRDTNFKFNFDLTVHEFVLSGLDNEAEDALEFESDLSSSFRVETCQCNSDFACYSTDEAPTINQNDSLQLCIKGATSDTNDDGNSSHIDISNFSVQLSAGDIVYDAVMVGTDTWEENILTKVTEQGDIKRISTPVLAQFFTEGHSNINIGGQAFLNFVDSRGKVETVASLSMVVNLSTNEGEGCFQRLISGARSFF